MRRLHDRGERWVGNYIRDLADRMGLTHWGFEYIAYPPAEQDEVETRAQIECLDGKYQAEIKLEADFLMRSPEEQRYTLVHELVHAHLSDMGNMIWKDLKEPLGTNAHALFDAGFTRAHEHATDGIARAWAEMLPLPPARYRQEEK